MLCIGYGRFPPQNMTDVWLTMLSMIRFLASSSIEKNQKELKRNGRHFIIILLNTKHSPVKQHHYCSVVHILEPGTDFLLVLLSDLRLLFFDLLEGADSDISFRLSYPPFLNRQGETRTILPTRQDWFQIRGQRLCHC
jgi:hypothetical protein